MNKLREIFRSEQPILPWAAVQVCDSSGNCYDSDDPDIPPAQDPKGPSTQRIPGKDKPKKGGGRTSDAIAAFLALFTVQPALA